MLKYICIFRDNTQAEVKILKIEKEQLMIEWITESEKWHVAWVPRSWVSPEIEDSK